MATYAHESFVTLCQTRSPDKRWSNNGEDSDEAQTCRDPGPSDASSIECVRRHRRIGDRSSNFEVRYR